MNEWGVVGVIVGVVSFFILIGAPILKFNEKIVRLEEQIKGLRQDMKRIEDAEGARGGGDG